MSTAEEKFEDFLGGLRAATSFAETLRPFAPDAAPARVPVPLTDKSAELRRVWLDLARRFGVVFVCGVDRSRAEVFFVGDRARAAADACREAQKLTSAIARRAHQQERERLKQSGEYAAAAMARVGRTALLRELSRLRDALEARRLELVAANNEDLCKVARALNEARRAHCR